MSDQPAKPTRSIWTLLNAVLPLVAFVVIGYIVWVSINPQPNAVPVAAAPDVTVAKTEAPDEGVDVGNTGDPLPNMTTADIGEADPPKAATNPPTQPVDDNASSKEPVVAKETSEESGSTPETAPTTTTADTEPAPAAKSKVVLGPAPKFYNADVAKFLFENKCSECHKLKRVENHSFADVTAVEKLIDKMVENGLEVNEKERSFLDYYVQSTFVD